MADWCNCNPQFAQNPRDMSAEYLQREALCIIEVNDEAVECMLNGICATDMPIDDS